jgi:phosphoglycerate dehydrogenase-like enzyme
VSAYLCRDIHVIGIRSKTKLSEKVLREAKNLIVIGCFCIGTNQVDLEYAAHHGIAVFNSPFANSRSVAELVIAEIISLARQLGDRSNEMHRGTWNKVSAKCWEIRGKTLGMCRSRFTPTSTSRAAVDDETQASWDMGTLAPSSRSWQRPWE